MGLYCGNKYALWLDRYTLAQRAFLTLRQHGNCCIEENLYIPNYLL